MEHDRLDNYYVLLTGSKNNAGDFLIKYRAKELLASLRPDRQFIDINAWENLDDNRLLDLVNNSKALILTGGPAIGKHMYGKTYRLTYNLDKIKVPIITFGLGWNSETGDWENIDSYQFTERSRSLIKRISESGYMNSVRDYHSYHLMKNSGVQNIMMTGCPVLYKPEKFDQTISIGKSKKILFSLGVMFAESKRMEAQVKKLITSLTEYFGNSNVAIAFHHSLDPTYLKTVDPRRNLFKKNVEFSKWLDIKKIEYIDISGSAEKLIESYSKVDLHIGYRVHAHIFMSSISKPSILLSEDGRGAALKEVLGGFIVNSFLNKKIDFVSKGLNRVFDLDQFVTDPNLHAKLMDRIKFELENELPTMQIARSSINSHYTVMRKFIMSLP